MRASLLKSLGLFSVFWPYYNFTLESFSHHFLLMVFHRSLNDGKSRGLFPVFWLISTMLKFRWSQSVLLFPTLVVLSHNNHDQLYKHIIHNHNNTMMTSDADLRRTHLSLYLKGLCVRGSRRPNRTATH